MSRPTSSAAGTASRPAVLPSLYVTSALLHGFDVYTTMRSIESGAVEANPLMRGTLSHPIALVAIKSTVTATSILAAERLWKNHHRTAAIVF